MMQRIVDMKRRCSKRTSLSLINQKKGIPPRTTGEKLDLASAEGLSRPMELHKALQGIMNEALVGLMRLLRVLLFWPMLWKS